MLRPDLIEFKPKTLAKSEEVNYNFEQMGDYVFGTTDELKALVNSAVANLNLQLTQNIFTGKIEIFAGKTDNIPLGWLLCDGQEVSRTEYEKLYNVISTKYGAGNGVTTFNVPNIIGKFLEGGTEAGIVKKAALPNISFGFNARMVTWDGHKAIYKPRGGLKSSGTVPESGSAIGSSYNGFSAEEFDFNAFDSNSIYKDDCETVQPPAVTVLYIIKT